MASRPRRILEAAGRAAISALVAAHLGCATEKIALAPARPDQPWTAAPDSEYVKPLRETSATVATAAPAAVAPQQPTQEQKDEQKLDAAPENRLQLEGGHHYALPELIDIAQRHHPETREAWEKARQAALSVGLAEAKYLPELTLTVIGGYQRTPIPVAQSLLPAGVVTFVTAETIPVLALKWLIFDFGQREAEVHEAEAKSFVANVTFTEAHEKVVFAVTHDYLALGAARAHVRVAEFAAANALRTQQISEAQRDHGLATVVEVAQARRETAQARFAVVKAQGAERTAYNTLVASMGVDPNGTIEVADNADRPLPAAPAQDVRALIEQALVSRPDILAAFGKVRAAEANLDKARATYWPTLQLSAQGYENIGWWSVDGPFFRLTQPGMNALLSLQLPIFDGGARQANVETARAELAAARAGLDGARDHAIQDVKRVYDQLQTGLAEYREATEVEAAARTALDAAVEAYRAGVGTLTDAISAANAAKQSQMQREDARTSVLTSAAELAFALGSAIRR
jgi:outer membrane protein TolC